MTDSPAALKQLKQARFDLILTDYNVPGMNGLELAQTMRQASPCMPVVLMTAYCNGAGLQDRIQTLDLNGCLHMPFSMKQMRDLL